MGKKRNEHKRREELVEKYEQNLADDKVIYFDAADFSLIFDHYIDHLYLDDAEEVIELALSIHPTNDELKMQNAKAMIYTGRQEQAEEYMKTLHDDGSTEFLLLKIENLLRLYKTKEATELIDDKIEELTDDLEKADFIAQVGFLSLDVDDYFEGIEYLEYALEIDAEFNLHVYVELIDAHEMTGSYEMAIYYNNRLLDLIPYSFDNWVNLGKLYALNRQYDKAVDAYDMALTIKEGNSQVLKMKALTLYLNDNAEEAVRIFNSCIKSNPDDESLYDSLIEGYEYLERYDKVEEVISEKERRFGSEGIVIRRAMLALLMNNVELAREFMELVPEEEQQTIDYFMLEGELMFEEKRYRESEAAYIKAALHSPRNEEVIDRLANVSVAQEKYEQAASYLEELLKYDPTYPTARARLAFVRFEIGVKEPFEKAMERFSEDELRSLLRVVSGREEENLSKLNRERLLIQLNEARENRVLFKNIKY